MALNPYFLQGSPGEQNLVQDLVNEHLRMFGIDVYYIPRKQLETDDILNEVQSSKFDDNFILEAYLNNYEGYGPSSDIMTKFGLKLTNELSLIISRERFEEFISPFLESMVEGETIDPNYDNGAKTVLSTRPKEGDLIYFPLGERLFEIKRVEFENPFYQLGKNYVYELKCELFEYEDERIDTGIEEIQDTVKDYGFISTLILVGAGSTATASVSIASTGVVGKVYLNDDGYNYTSAPVVTISEPPVGGQRATAVAILNKKSIREILLTNAGYGYTTSPTVSISGGGGTGAAATCSIVSNAVYNVNLLNAGSGYYKTPTATISSPDVGVSTATASVLLTAVGTISTIRISDSGTGYLTIPTITISPPPNVGSGNFLNDEEVVGSTSGARAFIKSWDDINGDRVLKISLNSGTFLPGESVVGAASSAIYSVKSYSEDDTYDPYAQNDEFEAEAATILDFSETNPFGTY
jgi:hypothetical protein